MEKDATVQLIDINMVGCERFTCFLAEVKISDSWRTGDELWWHGVFITLQ